MNCIINYNACWVAPNRKWSRVLGFLQDRCTTWFPECIGLAYMLILSIFSNLCSVICAWVKALSKLKPYFLVIKLDLIKMLSVNSVVELVRYRMLLPTRKKWTWTEITPLRRPIPKNKIHHLISLLHSPPV